MDQTCFGSRGRFWPLIRPLFHAGCSGRNAGKKSMDMAIPPAPKPTLTSDDPTGTIVTWNLESFCYSSRAESGRMTA